MLQVQLVIELLMGQHKDHDNGDLNPRRQRQYHAAYKMSLKLETLEKPVGLMLLVKKSILE